MSYKFQEGYIQDFSDTRIYFRKYITEKANKTIIAVHGVGDHSGRYMNLVKHFNKKKTNFYLIDNRGHGKSDGKRGHILLFGQYLDDLRIFVDKVREEATHHDIFLLGHSMGGNIVANYLIQRDSYFTGAILSAPGFKIAAKVNPVKKVMGELMSKIWPGLTMPSGLDTSHLTHDKKVITEYENDPMVHDKVSARWFTQFVWAGEFAIRNAKFIHCPVLVMHGSDDKIVSVDGSKEFYKNLETKKKDIELYEGFYHEIFNEIEKEKPLSTLEKWIKGVTVDSYLNQLIVQRRKKRS